MVIYRRLLAKTFAVLLLSLSKTTLILRWWTSFFGPDSARRDSCTYARLVVMLC